MYLCDGLTILGLMGGMSIEHLILATSWITWDNEQETAINGIRGGSSAYKLLCYIFCCST